MNLPVFVREKNKTETITFACHGGDAHCRFIVGTESETGRSHYCSAPAMPGSAYCAHHRALCAVGPKSPLGRRAIRDLEHAAGHSSLLPAELAHLASIAVPELDAAADPEDLAGCLDLPAPDRGDAE